MAEFDRQLVCSLVAVAATLLLHDVAAAQHGRAAVVVEGAGSRAAPIEASVGGALTGLGYQVLDSGAVQAARSFANLRGSLTPETAQRLRAALQADALVVVSVRPAPHRRRYVAVFRYTAAGTQQNFSEAPVSEVPALASRTVVSLTRPGAPPVIAPAIGAPMTAPAVGVPVTAPPVGAPVTAPPVGAPVTAPPVGAPATAPPVGAPVTAPPVGAPVTAPPVGEPEVAAVGPATAVGAPSTDAEAVLGEAGPASDTSSSSNSLLQLGGIIGLGLGAASWLLTPTVGGAAVCNGCDSHIGFGFIPLVGPWVNLDLTPGADGGLQAFYGLMGTLQLIGFGGGAAMLLLSMMGSPNTPAADTEPAAALPWVMPTEDGAVVGATGRF